MSTKSYKQLYNKGLKFLTGIAFAHKDGSRKEVVKPSETELKEKQQKYYQMERNFTEFFDNFAKTKGLEKIPTNTCGPRIKREVQIALHNHFTEGQTVINDNKVLDKSKLEKLEMTLKEINKLYPIWAALIETENISTRSDKVLKTILTDEKAFEFWTKWISEHGVNKPINSLKFRNTLSKEYPKMKFWETDVSDKCLKITPYTLRTVVECCGGWDNFLDACKVGNPFKALVCTNSRATQTNDTTGMNPTGLDAEKKFYKNNTTAGQAPYGTFFILIEKSELEKVRTKKDGKANEDDAKKDGKEYPSDNMDMWMVVVKSETKDSNKSPLKVEPATDKMPTAWIFENNGKIRPYKETSSYLAWKEEAEDISFGNSSEDYHSSWKIVDWRIYCNGRDDMFFSYKAEDGTLVKGTKSDDTSKSDVPVKFTFANYLPWVTNVAEEEEEEEDSSDEDSSDDDDDNYDDDDDDDDDEDED